MNKIILNLMILGLFIIGLIVGHAIYKNYKYDINNCVGIKKAMGRSIRDGKMNTAIFYNCEYSEK